MRAEPIGTAFPGPCTGTAEPIQRCLAKDPRNRYHDISDVRLDIQPSLIPGNRCCRLFCRPEAVASVGHRGHGFDGAIAVVVWNLRRMPAPDARPVMRFSDDLPEDRADINISHQLIWLCPRRRSIRLPRGGPLLRSWVKRMWLIRTGEIQRRHSLTDGNGSAIFPDGQLAEEVAVWEVRRPILLPRSWRRMDLTTLLFTATGTTASRGYRETGRQKG
jgi:hypothetical protein